MQHTIDVESLVVDRGNRRVLEGITFHARRGSVTGVLGPSGCGKSTMIRSIVGVQIIRSGSVRVLGLPAGDRRLRHRVRYVTQAPSVYGDLTVAENARYFARLLGIGHPEADRAVEQVGLSGAADQLVATLSGGQRTRASLACALVGEPEILVLDEPTVGLDPLVRDELWTTFHQLARGGATLLVSSHVMDEAGRCDQLLLMRDGRLLADAPPDDIRARSGTDDLEQAFLRLIKGQVAA
uniref:Efflux ABC transporter, ATP-binding protein n=1 Tax=uncultured Nocardioidaceae bacterium TaxID=253824 RepID=A0A6J4KZD3_9ACTN|nr:MAG: Efflux ABC transporter, ATP-binding protein [uncultured Nocardioidaceae bacterium]